MNFKSSQVFLWVWEIFKSSIFDITILCVQFNFKKILCGGKIIKCFASSVIWCSSSLNKYNELLM